MDELVARRGRSARDLGLRALDEDMRLLLVNGW